ncbi:hypothetical protein TREMEDRAFT_62108 [Tremella mesenterica DSM 1558]|uniref:uncharacterized protein n=1 Tax=Tremella mesenterica (strain ATCC 24925 / CBS 8224 / DSM 1558 / NBRC 9311 / NRRL Y-6157 / RJB 2259-6 / UBC 559-6) TaxID=578456 RepID=UPI0003F4975B|nr:uncharacterized protein TREMEDRAFT_62108 [Tremella mesenterica DSM 1558]EIW69254.1 hypothetical protein TREMEDRAFT_62108 [Tremella mesenterica DSM 1558]
MATEDGTPVRSLTQRSGQALNTTVIYDGACSQYPQEVMDAAGMIVPSEEESQKLLHSDSIEIPDHIIRVSRKEKDWGPLNSNTLKEGSAWYVVSKRNYPLAHPILSSHDWRIPINDAVGIYPPPENVGEHSWRRAIYLPSKNLSAEVCFTVNSVGWFRPVINADRPEEVMPTLEDMVQSQHYTVVRSWKTNVDNDTFSHCVGVKGPGAILWHGPTYDQREGSEEGMEEGQ